MASRVMQLYYDTHCDGCGGWMEQGEDFRFGDDDDKLCERCWPENQEPEPAPAKPVWEAEHHCHWPGCQVAVPPRMWGCSTHWFLLPKELRDLIWATYVPGQEITKTPSLDYLAVATRVQEWIAGRVEVGPTEPEVWS